METDVVYTIKYDVSTSNWTVHKNDWTVAYRNTLWGAHRMIRQLVQADKFKECYNHEGVQIPCK